MIKNIRSANETISLNVNEISILKENFPSCFRPDGSFDMTRFSEFLTDKIAITYEGYELKFLGKNYARLLSSLETEMVIVPDEIHNSLPENHNSENIYISGDNLDGLKHLLKSYAGKIKCIYIDPPYNTGTDGFVYNDKFNFTVNGLMQRLSIGEGQAQHILDLTTRGSASHSAWLMFMYPRLQLAKDLLSDDGAIFISIDDNEQANLKLICDDIFGEENCLGTIARATGQTTAQDSGGLGSSFDYAFVYGRHTELDIAGIPLNSHDLKRFDNEDKNGWYAYDQLRKTGSNDRREDRPNMYYAKLNAATTPSSIPDSIIADNTKPNFIYAYSIFKSTIAEILRYYLMAFLNKNITVGKDLIISSPSTSKLLASMIDQNIRRYSCKSLYEYILFQLIQDLDCPIDVVTINRIFN